MDAVVPLSIGCFLTFFSMVHFVPVSLYWVQFDPLSTGAFEFSFDERILDCRLQTNASAATRWSATAAATPFRGLLLDWSNEAPRNLHMRHVRATFEIVP
jgi:hypothetical protein